MRRPGNLSIKSSDWPAPLSQCRPQPNSKSNNKPNATKKAHFISFERLAVFTARGSKNAKAGLVALAVICYALCKLTSKSAQAPL
jgi:hypothetical protein